MQALGYIEVPDRGRPNPVYLRADSVTAYWSDPLTDDIRVIVAGWPEAERQLRIALSLTALTQRLDAARRD